LGHRRKGTVKTLPPFIVGAKYLRKPNRLAKFNTALVLGLGVILAVAKK
jgi:hypothetical protein